MAKFAVFSNVKISGLLPIYFFYCLWRQTHYTIGQRWKHDLITNNSFLPNFLYVYAGYMKNYRVTLTQFGSKLSARWHRWSLRPSNAIDLTLRISYCYCTLTPHFHQDLSTCQRTTLFITASRDYMNTKFPTTLNCQLLNYLGVQNSKEFYQDFWKLTVLILFWELLLIKQVIAEVI